MILGAPSISGVEPSDRIRKFWDEEDAALEVGDIDGATELNLRLWVDGPNRLPDQVDPRVREKVRDMQTAAFLKDIPDDVRSLALDPPAIDRLGEITIPVLVLTGDQDLEEKLATADTLEAKISNCRQITLPGVAHMLNMENPAQFNRQVLHFLPAS